MGIFLESRILLLRATKTDPLFAISILLQDNFWRDSHLFKHAFWNFLYVLNWKWDENLGWLLKTLKQRAENHILIKNQIHIVHSHRFICHIAVINYKNKTLELDIIFFILKIFRWSLHSVFLVAQFQVSIGMSKVFEKWAYQWQMFICIHNLTWVLVLEIFDLKFEPFFLCWDKVQCK